MNEILSLIKPKERIIISSVMSAFAAVLAVVIGIVSGVTAEEHIHRYEYHLEMEYDGDLDLVGFCVDVECKDPHYVKDVSDDATNRVVTEPTCCVAGVTEYTYVNEADGKTYTYSHTTATLPHAYVGEKQVNEDGSVTVNASCINEDCTGSEITVGAGEGLKLESTVEATCHTPKSESYSYTVNGVNGTVTVYTEEDVAHKLGGKYVTEYLLSDGVYKLGTEGMSLVENKALGCGESAEGCFVCEECGDTVSVMLGKVAHSYVYVEDATVNPTTTEKGSATVKCINEGCEDSISIELPIALEGENATYISTDHLAKTKTFKYSYTNDEYGFTVDFEYDIDFVEHIYQFVEDKSTAPTLTEEGTAYIGCSIEGCEDYVTVSIPQIKLSGDDKNSVTESNATEVALQVVKYSYTVEEYGIDIELELEIGEFLSHAYTYALEASDGEFVLVGRCAQPGCETPVIYDDAEVARESVPATCVSYAYDVWTCVKDGVTYTETVVFDMLGYSDHSYAYSAKETVNPDLNKTGLAYVRCENEGCSAFEKIVLPKIVVGQNAEITSTDNYAGIVEISYTYVSEEYGFTVECKTFIVIEHYHDYEYSLERVDGQFYLTAVCNKVPCEINKTYTIPVNPTLVGNSNTCVNLGSFTWVYVVHDKYVNKDIVIEYQADATEFAPHIYELVEEESKEPTLNSNGLAVIKCTVEDCQHTESFVLPMVEEGVNAETVIIEYDIKTLRYTYHSEEHGYTYELDLHIVLDHTHDYVYTLEKRDGEFVFVGTCSKPLMCLEPEIFEFVEPVFVGNTATCISVGKNIWSYERDGVAYTYDEDGDTLADHTYVYDEELSIAPTYDNEGKAYIRCDVPGCEYYTEATLPAMTEENLEILSHDEETGLQNVKYSYAVPGINFSVVIEFTRLYNHTHSCNNYELVPAEALGLGKFNLVGTCSNPYCGEDLIYTDVEVTLISNTSTCYQIGRQDWAHERDGETYICHTEFPIFADHSYDFISALSTAPTFTEGGKAYLACSVEGCGAHTKIDIPAMNEENTEILAVDDATGLHTVEYSYTIPEYDIQVVLQADVLYNHTHTCANYELVPAEALGLGKFNLVGSCSNPYCGEDVVHTDVEVVLISNTSTCTEIGRQKWAHEREGETYYCYTQFPIFADHTPGFDAEADSTVLPGLHSAGSIDIVCGVCGKLIEEAELPAISVGENAELESETEEEMIYNYTHTTEGGVTISLQIVVVK